MDLQKENESLRKALNEVVLAYERLRAQQIQAENISQPITTRMAIKTLVKKVPGSVKMVRFCRAGLKNTIINTQDTKLYNALKHIGGKNVKFYKFCKRIKNFAFK